MTRRWRNSDRSLDESIELMLGRLENNTVFSSPRFAGLNDDRALAEVELSVRSLVADREALFGDYAAAAIQYRHAETLVLAVHGRNSSAWFDLRTRQASNLAGLTPVQGVTDLMELLTTSTRVLSDHHPDTLRVQLALAELLHSQGQYESALDLLTQASAKLAIGGPSQRLLEAQIATATALAAAKLSRHQQAVAAAGLALDINQTLFGPQSLQTGEAALQLAALRAKQGQLQPAAD